ncbi:site-specific DNA-methyltransferase [soil metagenome]
MARTTFHLNLGDCVAGMREMVPESIDLVVTSPPYNLGIAYTQYADTLGSDAYLAWSREWVGEVMRVLKPDGSLFLNVGSVPASPFMPYELILALRGVAVLQNTIHWIKSISVETRAGQAISVGHFKPINSKRFINDCHEFVFHLTKSGGVQLDRRAAGVPYQDKSNIARWGHTGGVDMRCRGNTWFIPYETILSRAKERPHPATFPPALAERCIALHGKAQATVMLEPFLGIGSAAVGARRAQVAAFHGFEIDPAYLEVAKARIADAETVLL